MTRVLAALALVLVAADGRAAPLRVCTHRFNTADEVAVFERHLRPPDFEIVDLSPTIDTAAAGPAAACRPDLRCDVVVYSGEFGGRFFGSYGTSVGLQDLEEASCRARCDGLFHQPREVFLLGCNTLATKDQDSRTPAQYLQVLREHGFDRASAERVVQLRYGPLGQSFREASRRIFAGVPRLYGFSSVAPRAAETVPRLEAYFRAVGDYRRHLERVAREPAPPNAALKAAFASTGLVQTTGLAPSDAAARDRAQVCAVHDDARPLVERLRTVRGLMDRPDFLAFVPTIQTFLAHLPEKRRGTDEQAIFAQLQRHDGARAQVLDLVRELDVSALQMELADLAVHLGWLAEDELRRLAVTGVRRLLERPITSEAVDVTCAITRHAPVGDAVGIDRLPQRLFEVAEGIRLVDCIAPVDARVNAWLASGLDSADLSVRLWAAYALSRRLPLDEVVLAKLVRRLDDPSPHVRERVRWILTAQRRVPAGVRAAVRARDPGLADAIAR